MADAKGVFKNRIIGYDTKPADQFQANALNYRKHPQRQRDAVNASLREIGWIATVIENRTTGNLIDGHERVWQALKNNEPVPYLQVELTEEEERLALAIFDPITNMAEADAAILDELLQDVNTGEAALQELLTGLAEDAVLYTDKPIVEDPGAQMSKADELQAVWNVQPGDLWQLGDHRLICGDCTDAATVERVMGGDKASLLMADPEYDAGMSWLDNEQLETIDHWLIMAGDRQHAESISKHRCKFNQFIIVYFRQFSWNLNVYIPILQHVCIAHYRQERAKNFHLNGLHSVIECASKFDRNTDHPHAKHVEIIDPLVSGFSIQGSNVLDLFSGSGTTVIACEQLGRRCRAVELHPPYVAVALQRWADMTGKTPTRID